MAPQLKTDANPFTPIVKATDKLVVDLVKNIPALTDPNSPRSVSVFDVLALGGCLADLHTAASKQEKLLAPWLGEMVSYETAKKVSDQLRFEVDLLKHYQGWGKTVPNRRQFNAFVRLEKQYHEALRSTNERVLLSLPLIEKHHG